MATHDALIKTLASEPATSNGDVPAPTANPSAQQAGAPKGTVIASASNFDLASYFMHRLGHLDAELLGRHIVLNPTVRPLGADSADWMLLVEAQNARLRALADNYDVAKLQEIIQVIETGQIAPEERSPPTDQQLRSTARTLLDSSPEIRAQGYDVDSLTEELRKAPPVLDVFEDHVVHEGRVYLTKRFTNLPTSSRMFEDVKFFASECLIACHAFFLARGYAPDQKGIASALESLYVMSSHRADGNVTPHRK